MSGALADMRRRGVEAVHASSVDNALVRSRQDILEIAISEIAISEITISGDRYLRGLCAVDKSLVRERDIRRSLSPEITISGDHNLRR